jgi:rubredoxin
MCRTREENAADLAFEAEHPDTDEHRAGCRHCQYVYDSKLPDAPSGPAIPPVQFACPKCQSTDIWENNVEHVRLRVTKWITDPDADDFGEPDDFGEHRTVDDTIRTVEENEAPRWYCGDCGEEFDTLTNDSRVRRLGA